MIGDRLRVKRRALGKQLQQRSPELRGLALRQVQQHQGFLHLRQQPGVVDQAGHQRPGLGQPHAAARHGALDDDGGGLAAALVAGEQAVQQRPAVFPGQRLVRDLAHRLHQLVAEGGALLRPVHLALGAQQVEQRLIHRAGGVEHGVERLRPLVRHQRVRVLPGGQDGEAQGARG